jgi:hypothetical protein
MMSLLPELDLLAWPFLQRCQSYGLRLLGVFASLRLILFPAQSARAGALQDAPRDLVVIAQRVSVLECGGPPPLFMAHETRIQFQFNPAWMCLAIVIGRFAMFRAILPHTQLSIHACLRR